MGRVKRNPSFTLHLTNPNVVWLTTSSPIPGVRANLNITMKRGMRPIGNPLNMLVFYRVVMDVIHMTPPVVLVAQCMFPITALPDAAFALRILLGERKLQSGKLRENAALIRRQWSG
jgi:hypothetical protein